MALSERMFSDLFVADTAANSGFKPTPVWVMADSSDAVQSILRKGESHMHKGECHMRKGEAQRQLRAAMTRGNS